MNFSFQYLPQVKLLITILVISSIAYYVWKGIKKDEDGKIVGFDIKRFIIGFVVFMLWQIIGSMIHYNPAKEDRITYQRITEQDFAMQERDEKNITTVKSFDYKKELNSYDESVTQRQNKIHQEAINNKP